jgi:hypothetical protein
MCPECVPDLDRGDEHLDSSDSRRSRRELVEVELELLKLVVVPAIMQLSCDSRVYVSRPDTVIMTSSV